METNTMDQIFSQQIQKTLNEIAALRSEQPARINDRLLVFEKASGRETVTYNDHEKETALRHSDGTEHVVLEPITQAEKEKFDVLYDMLESAERENHHLGYTNEQDFEDQER